MSKHLNKAGLICVLAGIAALPFLVRAKAVDQDSGRVQPAEQNHPNVLLICMDTVRADRLGCYGYQRHQTSPHLDELATRSIVFRDASATEGWTKPSVASFFTGIYPAQHGVYTGSARQVAGKTTDILPEDCLTLGEVFEDHGYNTAAFIHNEHLSRGNGFEQGFQEYADRLGDARDIRWHALDWLDSRAEDRPFFLYLHFLDAHYPYPVPEEYATMFAGEADVSLYRSGDWRGLRDAINSGDRVLTDEELNALGALYDGSIRYIDDQLGMLFRALKRRGQWDNTVICVLADHGEEFMEHGRIGHGHGLHENLLRVPWILRIPGRTEATVTAPVSLVDLFPTLLSASGLKPRTPSEGVDRLASPNLARSIFAEHKERRAYLQSYRNGASKLLRRFTRAEHRGSAPSLAELIPPRTRWQVEIRPSSEGGLRAVCLKPRSEPPSNPVQIKGMVKAPAQSTLSLAGITVRHSAGTEYYGAIDASQDGAAKLSEGVAVKAEGTFAKGCFLAKRIKFYPLGKEVDPVIRGRIEEVEGVASEGRIRIERLWIDVDRKTDWLISDLDLGKDHLGREEVAWLLGNGADEGIRIGYSVSSQLFDLATDPQERHPMDADVVRARLASDLDGLVSRLVGRREYGVEDEAVLSAEALQNLRAIGYVD